MCYKYKDKDWFSFWFLGGFLVVLWWVVVFLWFFEIGLLFLSFLLICIIFIVIKKEFLRCLYLLMGRNEYVVCVFRYKDLFGFWLVRGFLVVLWCVMNFL